MHFSWRRVIRSMMGERTVMQEALFVGFSIERHVPADVAKPISSRRWPC